ncbi:hypothetical protein Ahy_B07g088933 [Arachis hypogaea]|uniref:Uncharacterized protein n=1 Tax=Arachis hypogaea TaxID=3818 RepID=A0A444YFY0_ARAHY|nr:hypothetical protein Ahy_B07g088933 [Arachis hypogaea]
MFASKSTTEATLDPTAVPFTRASPSLGFSSKNPECSPAKWKASFASRDSPEGPRALEFCRPVSNAAIKISPNHLSLKGKSLIGFSVGGSAKASGNTIDGNAFFNAVHDPLAAGLDACPRRLSELHLDLRLTLGNGSHLRHG